MTDVAEALPAALAGHLLVSAVPLIVAVLVAVPLGLASAHRPAVRAVLLGASGLVQTIPGLALVALMVPVLVALGDLGLPVPALGALPVGLALTAYAVLPILRNTVVGVASVDPAIVESAHALGMTPGQVRLAVELPLAAPVVLAGIRTAAVWVVGTATLATPVGAQSLGAFIFAGLQTRSPGLVLVGCVGAAALALLVDAALAVVERAVAGRRWRLAAGAVAAEAALALTALVVLGRGDRSAVVVAGKPFTEQYVLTRALAATLRDAGFRVDRRDGLGSSLLVDGLAAGELHVGVDYSGTLWAHRLGRTDRADRAAVVETVCAWLAAHDHVRCVGPLGFENAYALAVRRADAEAHGWASLGDLAADAPRLRVGSDYEFFRRPEWAAVRAAYGLSFGAEATFDPSFLYDAVSTGDVDVVTVYTSDGRIDALDLVVLADPAGALPPYDALLLVSDAAPRGVAEALAPLVGSVDPARMRAANRAVDLEHSSPEAAAALLRPER